GSADGGEAVVDEVRVDRRLLPEAVESGKRDAREDQGHVHAMTPCGRAGGTTGASAPLSQSHASVAASPRASGTRAHGPISPRRRLASWTRCSRSGPARRK